MSTFLHGNQQLQRFETAALWTSSDFCDRLVPAMSNTLQLQQLRLSAAPPFHPSSQPSTTLAVLALTRWLLRPDCSLLELSAPYWRLSDEQLDILFHALPRNRSLRALTTASSSSRSTTALKQLLRNETNSMRHFCSYQPIADPTLLKLLQHNSVCLFIYLFIYFFFLICLCVSLLIFFFSLFIRTACFETNRDGSRSGSSWRSFGRIVTTMRTNGAACNWQMKSCSGNGHRRTNRLIPT